MSREPALVGPAEPVARAVARSRRGRRLALICPPVIGAALAYLNALHNPFVWDDFHTVADNRSLDTLWNLRAIVLQDVSRPLVNLSFALNYALGGVDPTGYHVANIAIHLLCGHLIFGLVRRTLALPRLAVRCAKSSPSQSVI